MQTQQTNPKKKEPAQLVSIRIPLATHSKLMGKAIESNQTFTQVLLSNLKKL
jgi:hypothetical protein